MVDNSDDEENNITFENIEYNPDTIISDEDINKFYNNYNTKNNISENILSKYEKTKIISQRIDMINKGAIVLIDNPEKYNSVYDIVIEELKLNKIPFIIKRNLGNKYEYWKLADLKLI